MSDPLPVAPPALRAPRLWVAVSARSAVALALGLSITFSADHSAAVGLAMFGVGMLASGVTIAWSPLAREGWSGPARILTLIQAAVTVTCGGIAMALGSGGSALLLTLVAVVALGGGAVELASGLLLRRRHPFARDQSMVAVISLVLGVATVLVPSEFTQPFSGVEPGVDGVLTASIVVVGLLGGWAVIVGVLLGISAVSLRGAREVGR